MARFWHDDKMQYTSVSWNEKLSCNVMCTHRVLKRIPVFRLNIFRTSTTGNELNNCEARNELGAMNYIRHKCVMLNFKLIFAVFLRNLQWSFLQDLDFKKFCTHCCEVLNRKDTLLGRQTDTPKASSAVYAFIVIVHLCAAAVVRPALSRNKSEHVATDFEVTIKANSHIPCRSHVAPMPFPCHAVPLMV
jgi:hypothetical protein